MIICKSRQDVRQRIAQIRETGSKVALVPTMGALHEGHLSLVRSSKRRGAFTVMSIFVNPLQFNEQRDFELYQRDLERDTQLAESCGVDLLFAPDVNQIYPDSDDRLSEQRCTVRAGSLARAWEGQFRPGHFDGVVTVVSILFNIIQPDFAIFGEKDYQQVKVIEEMTRDFAIPVQILAAPIVRESDGLAMSSRNVRLSVSERKQALAISASLRKAAQAIESGERSSKAIQTLVSTQLHDAGLKVDYVAVVDPKSLKVADPISSPVRILVAAWSGNVRLIDNIGVLPA